MVEVCGMKKRLLLVTEGFPFGESERSFLSEEVRQLSQSFDLFILARDNKAELLYPIQGIQGVERFETSSFWETGSPHALLNIFDFTTVKEVFRLFTQKGANGFLGKCKELALYRYHAWEAEQKIRAIVEREKIDIVYTFWCTECTFAAISLKKTFPKLKVVTRFHGYDLYEERSKIGWQPFRKAIAARCDGLYFPSEMGRTYFWQHWGCGPEDKARICYLGSGIPEPGEIKRKDTLQLISCSNMIPLKRIELIIDGLALLPNSEKVTWHHFGEGCECHNLEERAKEKLSAGCSVQWVFHGYVKNTELISRYRELGAGLFITTSSTEGLPVSLMEAFSLGIPAIATAVGGIPEMVADGDNGYLLPENVKADQVAGAIMKYLDLTEEQRQSMSQTAFSVWQEKFNAQKNAQRFVIFLKELLSE